MERTLIHNYVYIILCCYVVIIAHKHFQDPQDCRLSPLEVDTPYTATQFLLVSGLEREQESAFFSLALTLVDGYTFLFAANGDGQLFQVLHNLQLLCLPVCVLLKVVSME